MRPKMREHLLPAVLLAAAFLGLGGAIATRVFDDGLLPFVSKTTADQLSKEEQNEITRKFYAHGPVALDAVKLSDLDRAIASMQLTDQQEIAMREEIGAILQRERPEDGKRLAALVMAGHVGAQASNDISASTASPPATPPAGLSLSQVPPGGVPPAPQSATTPAAVPTPPAAQPAPTTSSAPAPQLAPQPAMLPMPAPMPAPAAVMPAPRLSPQKPTAMSGQDGNVRLPLAWLTLWDYVDEDGDIVRVVSSGYTRLVPILHKPVTLAVPMPPSGVVNIVGVHDGYGGITVGISSGALPVALPVLAEGQVIGVPVTVR
jgi:hypothetical protein